MTKIFPCRFFGSGIWECLRWVVLAQDLPSTCGQDMNWGCRHLKIGLELGVCSQAGSHAWMKISAGCWWKASNIYHVDIAVGLLECPHNMLASFPRWIIPKRAQWNVQQPQRSHFIVIAISFGYTGQPYFCGRNLHKGVNKHQERSITEAILESGYHKKRDTKRDYSPATHFRVFQMEHRIWIFGNLMTTSWHKALNSPTLKAPKNPLCCSFPTELCILATP